MGKAYSSAYRAGQEKKKKKKEKDKQRILYQVIV